MATLYSVVFDAYLSQMTDPLYAELTPTQSEADMIKILNRAIERFEYPKISLERNDSTKTFIGTLGYSEIEIIARLMKLEWIERQLHDINTLRQKFSDRDFKITSQAAHLEALIKLKDSTEKTFFRIQKKYSYRSQTSRTPDFSGLAGG